jgi:hypothetical protein
MYKQKTKEVLSFQTTASASEVHAGLWVLNSVTLTDVFIMKFSIHRSKKVKTKVQLSSYQAVEAYMIVRCWISDIV